MAFEAPVPVGTALTSPDQRYLKELEEPVPEQNARIPDGGYIAWRNVACQFVTNSMTWGINSSFGVYLNYYINHDVFSGASNINYAFVGGLSISMAMILAPVMTWAVGRYGFRAVYLQGAFVEFAGLFGGSYATSIWQLYLSQGVAFGWGMSGLFVASVGIPPQWFSKRRSLATGICAAGSGAGGLLWSLVIDLIIRVISFHWALRISGIVALFCSLICAKLLRNFNDKGMQNQHAIDMQVMRNRGFWGIAVWGFFSMFGYVSLLFSLSAYASSVGLSYFQASIVTAMLNAGTLIGRPFVGQLCDLFGRWNVAIIYTFATGLACFVIWNFATSFGVLVFFAIVAGAICGTFWGTVAACTAEVVGLYDLNAALSLVWLAIVIPCTFSESIALSLRDSSIGFRGVINFTGTMYILAGVAGYWVKAWKQKEARGKEKMWHPFYKT